MTTYPLPTLAATITSAGISAPSYSDIYQSLQASFQSIYGSDSYIQPDSQDGQMLAIFAQAINDCNNACIATYNAYSPATAIGTGLSSNVKINGLRRDVPTNSTVTLTIGGTAGKIITNGIVQDTNGNQWFLPASVTIGTSGTIVATATASTAGAITAALGSVNKIVTNTLGWQTVTNPGAAVPGAPVEDDAELRVRQGNSTSIAAQSILAAIAGAVGNITGVQQVAAYENDTNSTNALGLPPHSMAIVVEGGSATAVAQTIAQKKNPGTATVGTTTVLVTDSVGIPSNINFYEATQVEFIANISIKALQGYTTTIGNEIIANLVAYINGLGIYANEGLISISSLYEPIYATSSPKSYNVTGITIALRPNSLAASDIQVAFNDLPFTVTSDISLTVS